jgi:hypothetical protein
MRDYPVNGGIAQAKQARRDESARSSVDSGEPGGQFHNCAGKKLAVHALGKPSVRGRPSSGAGMRGTATRRQGR